MSVVVIDTEELRAIIGTEIRAALAERVGHAEAAPEWLDARATADLLKVNPRTVAKLAAAGRLPASRIGRLLRFRRADILAFLDSQTPR